MPVPVFTAGETLDASEMNAVGLWKVASATLSGATTTISNVFSSNFDSYRLVINGASCSTGARFISLAFGPSSIAGYNTSFYSGRVDLTGTTFSGATDANTAFWNTSLVVEAGATSGGVIDIHNPFNSVQASFQAQGTDPRYSGAGAFWRAAGGSHNQTGAYTQLVIGCIGDTFDAGTATVYGYRN